MNILVITEKHHVSDNQRDGGARVISMLDSIQFATIKILDFSVSNEQSTTTSSLVYPFTHECRFQRRLLNKEFVCENVQEHLPWSDVVVFVHCSMMFGIDSEQMEGIRCVLFPMFTTSSYLQSGERVPQTYIDEELRVLKLAELIITPSLLEKQMLLNNDLSENKICVISRGISSSAKYVLRTIKSHEPINCFSLGSIKPQKNPIGVLKIFEKIAQQRLGSKLRFLGPIQDQKTHSLLLSAMKDSEFGSSVSIGGPVAPEDLFNVLLQYHVHISASKCETFGRAIIETAAMGIPNILVRPFNAAAPLLAHRLGATVTECTKDFDAHKWINDTTLESRSKSLMGLGDIFDEELERNRIAAVIQGGVSTVVVDFDGTLYHKNSSHLTAEWTEKIASFERIIICSARGTESLLAKITEIGLKWDALVSYSGAVLTINGGDNQIISVLPSLPVGYSEIRLEQHLLQGMKESRGDFFPSNYRKETYAGFEYLLPWKTTKLRGATLALSHYLNIGNVEAFGDGEHDLPMIHFFGGKIVISDGRAINPEVNLSE